MRSRRQISKQTIEQNEDNAISIHENEIWPKLIWEANHV